MSPSEEVRLKTDTTRAADTVVALIERLADADDLSPDDLRSVISAATRLYANACTRAGEELLPVTAQVSTTDAVTLACALVRSQDLTPFEMAMWFSRGKTHG
jgi:hypothetical protein